jgi:hypothetical protein
MQAAQSLSFGLRMRRDIITVVGVIPQPPVYFQLDFPGANFIKNTDAVHFYTIDDVVCDLPVVGQGVDFTDSSSKNIIFTNDSSLTIGTEVQGWVRLLDSSPGVWISILYPYVEALTLLGLSSEPGSFSRGVWMSDLTYVITS